MRRADFVCVRAGVVLGGRSGGTAGACDRLIALHRLELVVWYCGEAIFQHIFFISDSTLNEKRQVVSPYLLTIN
jgi:hypothetical protein